MNDQDKSNAGSRSGTESGVSGAGTNAGLTDEGTRSKTFATGFGASGIYDVSRMNIRPQDATGASISHAGAAALAKRKSNAALVRGLVIAIVLPMLGGGGYLLTSGLETETKSSPSATPISLQSLKQPALQVETAPRAHVALPKPIAVDATVLRAAAGSEQFIDSIPDDSTVSATTFEPKPLKLTLNHKGELISPFSFQLDENGAEISHFEFDRQHALHPMGPFETSKNLSAIQIPEGFSVHVASRPFTLTEAEKKRIIRLRDTAIEVRIAVQSAERFAFSRLPNAPFAVKSLTIAKDNKDRTEALTELRWLKDASFTRDIASDRSIEKRLLETLRLWARTYKGSGSAITDLPLLDALYAYDMVRHLWSTTDQAEIDSFFKSLVEAQLVNVKFEKSFSLEHAAHLRFAIAVGYVTGHAQTQFYGQELFKIHLQNSPLVSMDSFGNEDVLILQQLLQAAFVLERVNLNVYQNPKLNRAVDVLATASQTTRLRLLETLALAAYFRQDLYPRLPALALAAGISGSRFGTNEGTLLAAIRRPTTVLGAPTGSNRLPATNGVPVKLPPKRIGK